jgi:hypothetical protein
MAVFVTIGGGINQQDLPVMELNVQDHPHVTNTSML